MFTGKAYAHSKLVFFPSTQKVYNTKEYIFAFNTGNQFSNNMFL